MSGASLGSMFHQVEHKSLLQCQSNQPDTAPLTALAIMGICREIDGQAIDANRDFYSHTVCGQDLRDDQCQVSVGLGCRKR